MLQAEAEQAARRKREKNEARQVELLLQAKMRKDKEGQIRVAAEFCWTAYKEGSLSATADRVAGRVSNDVWDTLYHNWKPGGCKWLAQLAQDILDAKAAIHKTFADVTLKLSGWTPLHKPEQIFAHQLLKSIPLPGDEQFVATAYGVRLVGVYLCAVRNINLVNCACFRPLAIEHTKEQVKQYLVATGNSWMQGPSQRPQADPAK